MFGMTWRFNGWRIILGAILVFLGVYGITIRESAVGDSDVGWYRTAWSLGTYAAILTGSWLASVGISRREGDDD